MDEYEKLQKVWLRTASVVVVITASILVALGLFLAGKMEILPNGTLLGGLFTILYGVGLIIASQSRYLIFFVTTTSLDVIVAAGYLKFVRSERAISNS